MKQALFSIVRTAHMVSARRSLPARVAIYFHSLERDERGAFAEAIGTFLDRGYRTVGPQEFAREEGDDRRLFVSFDDNFRTWHSALDLFAELGVTATFYVNSQPFRDVASAGEVSRYLARICHAGEMMTLTRAELRELHEAGHIIGCHTHTHPMLSQLEQRAWPAEIERSKRILEDLIGGEVADFSYPFGMRRHFSAALRSYCAGLGFRTIATGIPGLQHLRSVDPLAIHRTGWKFSESVDHNIDNLSIDARIFAGVTGRSAVG